MAKLKLKYNNSTYSVTDDSVRDGEIKAITDVYGSKNLLAPVVISQTDHGVTFVSNADGSFSVSGKSTSQFFKYYGLPVKIPAGHYIFTKEGAAGILSIFLVLENGLWVVGDEITVDSPIVILGLSIESDFNAPNPVTIYPMIRDARITDSTYVQYAMTNRALTEQKSEVVDLGEITGGIGAAWDLLTVYDKPVMCCWGESGKHLGMLYKYSGGNYGMGFCQAYYSNSIITLSVSGGVKTTKTINPNT